MIIFLLQRPFIFKINNMRNFLFVLFILMISIFSLTKCKKSNNIEVTPPIVVNKNLPTLVTTAAVLLNNQSITSGGNVISSGSDSIIERGICYNSTGTPTILNNKITAGSGNGIFNVTITPVVPNTKYYLRAYATNIVGTGYGEEMLIQTQAMDSAKLLFIGGGNTLYCFNALNGNLKWTRTLGGVIPTPAFYSNGNVYTSCEDGKLYCLDTLGILKWSVNVGNTSNDRFTPSVANGIVYMNTGRYVYAYNAITGGPLWNFDILSVQGSQLILSGMTLKNDILFINTINNLIALNPQTGSVKWLHSGNYMFIKPTVHNNKIYILNEGLSNQELKVIDIYNGNLIWTKYLSYSSSDAISMSVAEGKIFLNKGAIIAMDTLNGSVLWTRGSYNVSSAFAGSMSPVVRNGFLHNVSFGYVTVFNANTGLSTSAGSSDYGSGNDAINGNDVTVLNGYIYYGTRNQYIPNRGRVRGLTISTNGLVNFDPGTWASSVLGDFTTTPCIVTKSGKMHLAGDIY